MRRRRWDEPRLIRWAFEGAFGDGFVMFGQQLDGGGGSTGTGLMPWGTSGAPSNYSKGGAAAKLRISNTVIRYGDQFPVTPVFGSFDPRLLPGTAKGFSVDSNELKSWNMQAGYLTAATAPDSSNRNGEIRTNLMQLPAAANVRYAGLAHAMSKDLQVSLYGSTLADTWNQYYTGAKAKLSLTEASEFFWTFDFYRTQDTGRSIGGQIKNTTFCTMASIRSGAHKMGVGLQKVNSDEPMDWATLDGSFGNVSLSNIMQVSHFTDPHETSWQIRYDFNFAGVGIPGLTFMSRYTRGDGMRNSGSRNLFYTQNGAHLYDDSKGNKHWERNSEIAYVVQSGRMRDLTLRLRQSSQRGTAGNRYPDHDEVRLILE